jgi:hypothetical protein
MSKSIKDRPKEKARKLRLAVQRAARHQQPAGMLARLGPEHGGLPVLRVLAGLQDGQFATAQATALGLSRSAIRWLATSGETVLVGSAVWRFGTATGDADECITGCLRLWPHGTISHDAAAAHHGLRLVVRAAGTGVRAHVTVPHGLRRSPGGLILHRTRSLPPHDRLWVAAVPYTALARTVCDLADSADPWGTLTRVDDAIARGASQGWIHSRASALAAGRPAVILVRDATAPTGAAAFRSWLERTADHVYRAAHLPAPEWNVPVRDAAGLIGVVDALWPLWRVVSEKEGLRFHTPPATRRRDAERFNRLLDAEYAARRFTWHDVVDRPLYVATTLARPLIAAGAPIDLTRIPRRIEIPDLPFGLPARPAGPGWGG